MQSYDYTAISMAGAKTRGQLAANNEFDLYQRLRENGLELLSAKPSRADHFAGLITAPVRNRDLLQLFLHLQHLTGAGVPLVESLTDVRDAIEQRRLRDVVTDVLRDVTEGRSLSEAFDSHPETFGPVFHALLAAGEASGNLTDAFAQLVRHLKWTELVTARIRKAVRYPTVILSVMVALFFFMMLMVVPQVVDFLLGSGQELPLITQSLIATSDFVQGYWWLLILVPLLLAVLRKTVHRLSEDLAQRLDRLSLHLPLVGPLVRKIALSRFSHFFATMFRSGVPILECLETARTVVSNRSLSQSLGVVLDDVQQGIPLSRALRNTGEFPSLVVRMVVIGEESGRLGETLENVTEFYDQDVSESVDRMIAMIEPALTLFAGVMMLWIVLGVFGPIYDSFSKLG
ncbi:MAG TPA: type II secretion system F family protein [Candidatus Sulfotelmatobacter sp.]|jgi:type IV pilus assembly protein PilC|nr:type II secretion system F family protein [Candidatus Sulfotelmatobacter sp.]